MNDIQRKLLEDKIKRICKGCSTVFDEEIIEFFEKVDAKIDQLTGFVKRRDIELCATCAYFLNADESHFEEVVGECTFGCARPQNPIGCCKAFKGRFS